MVFFGGYEGRWRGGGWFVIVLYGMFRKKKDSFRIHGVSSSTFSTMLYGKLWEHVAKTALKK